ncbi:PREDICTED: uncharacterized protein LOC105109348 isoform X2 [Populus euphratica]|uniref:Uncharacterized protein LOC105109345 isoform X2 n=1 Tax=Populus euphratica TaxID=75702 RepID=A0AAJ6T0I2_POPEU|nr:PREDICTED: uncharacterized protein LOC105109345 isoform X2 [Populus euphratica]XP_011002345.1 PREDICTED: uncharacterized protein LOC105109348 isoform X2 [Populus euphratica]
MSVGFSSVSAFDFCWLRVNGQEKGMHMDELCQQLKLPMEKIKESIRSLEDGGLIYSTVDEFQLQCNLMKFTVFLNATQPAMLLRVILFLLLNINRTACRYLFVSMLTS